MTNQIAMPTTSLVHCPKFEYDLAPVADCAGCEHFRGLIDRFPGMDRPFGKKYMLLCIHDPQKREILDLAK